MLHAYIPAEVSTLDFNSIILTGTRTQSQIQGLVELPSHSIFILWLDAKAISEILFPEEEDL